jgi:hypothetical protein
MANNPGEKELSNVITRKIKPSCSVISKYVLRLKKNIILTYACTYDLTQVSFKF